MAAREPFQDLGPRSFLGVIAAGSIAVGLFLTLGMAVDIDPPRRDVMVLVGFILALGALGVVGAREWGGFGRSLLAGLGIILLGGAIDGWLVAREWDPGMFGLVAFGTMLVFGVLALVVALMSALRHRRERPAPAAERPAQP